MTFWAILILLVLVAGLVAYVGDLVAKRVGKRHWRFLGLRPRTTATLVAVGTGILIGLGAFGAFFLLVQEARETILQAEAVRQERDRLRTEVRRLESRAASIFSQYEQLKIERDEFEKNNTLLARQLAQNAELQRQTRQDLENALVEREKLRQEVENLQAASTAQREAIEQLRQVRLSLLQEQERLQKEKAQLLADRTALLAQARKAEQQLQAFEAASREAKAHLNRLQARSKELEARLHELEAEKRSLEGDVAILGSTPTPSQPSDDRLLETLQRDNSELKSKLAEALRELQQLRERTQLLATSLEKRLRLSLLAEELVMPGNEQVALNEISRRVDGRVRLIGLRGVEILANPSLVNLKPGVFLARIHSIGPDGRVRVSIEYRAREQVFPQGEILATTTLLLPASTSEISRRLSALSQVAENRLTEAGWIPEKLAQGGIALEEFVDLAAQLFGKRGSARVAVVALDHLYPTEPPRLGLRLLP